MQKILCIHVSQQDINPLSQMLHSKTSVSSFYSTPLFLPCTYDRVWMHSSASIYALLFNPCQLAESHHNLILLRRCTLGWQQSARQTVSEKNASADQLHQHFLLRRTLSCWKRVCIHLHANTHTNTQNFSHP